VALIRSSYLSEIDSSDAFIDAGDFGDAKSEITVDDYDFAASNEAAGDEELSGLVDSLIELDDGTGHEAEDVAKKHLSLAETGWWLAVRHRGRGRDLPEAAWSEEVEQRPE